MGTQGWVFRDTLGCPALMALGLLADLASWGWGENFEGIFLYLSPSIISKFPKQVLRQGRSKIHVRKLLLEASTLPTFSHIPHMNPGMSVCACSYYIWAPADSWSISLNLQHLFANTVLVSIWTPCERREKSLEWCGAGSVIHLRSVPDPASFWEKDGQGISLMKYYVVFSKAALTG